MDIKKHINIFLDNYKCLDSIRYYFHQRSMKNKRKQEEQIYYYEQLHYYKSIESLRLRHNQLIQRLFFLYGLIPSVIIVYVTISLDNPETYSNANTIIIIYILIVVFIFIFVDSSELHKLRKKIDELDK